MKDSSGDAYFDSKRPDQKIQISLRELENKNRNIDQLEKRIAEIYGSTSWKIAKPFRAIEITTKALRINGLKIPRALKRNLQSAKEKRNLKLKENSIRKLDTYSWQPSQETKILLNSKISILIPVYGNLDKFKKLLPQILLETSRNNLEVVIIDDCYDNHSTEQLNRICEETNFKLIKNLNNLGYLRSMNNAYKDLNSEFSILINSDVILPGNWLERALSPFRDSRIALATALATNSGANLSIEIPAGRSWIEIDRWLQERTPEFPEACTAVGYFMVIRNSILGMENLFSEDFIDGYGEDSDLHFRIKKLGHVSCVIDNLLVHHSSGASYGNKLNIEQIRESNMTTFLEKWESNYSADLELWNLISPVAKIQKNLNARHERENIESSILFIAPDYAYTSGGVETIIDIIEHLNIVGISTSVVNLSGHITTLNGISCMASDDLHKLSNIQIVVATGIGTYEAAVDLARSNNAKLFNFLQGPEDLFNVEENLVAFKSMLATASVNIAVSPFLEELAKLYGADKITQIHLGPDTDIFYSKELERKNIVAIPSRKEAAKGNWLSAPLVALLEKEGWEVVTYGHKHEFLDNFSNVTQLGWISKNQLARVLSEAKFLLDLSLFEGLGLSPMEAGFCGAIPILTRKGGPESIFEVGRESEYAIWLNSPFDFKAVSEVISDLNSKKFDDIRSNWMNLAENRNLRIARIEFSEVLQKF